MKSIRTHWYERDWLVLVLFGLVTVVLYGPVLSNGFLTDDYASLYRILVEKRILLREWLRPMMDITFYGNLLLGGLHPLVYYVFNFCIHVLTCYMVYKVGGVIPLFSDERQRYFAFLAGLVFAVYPFHNESVVWLSGRLSSMAALSALCGLYLSLTRRSPWNFLLPALLLIVGLLAYTSILMLPMIILILREDLWRSRKAFWREVGAWAAVGGVYLLLRYWLAGSLVPAYGRSNMGGKEGGGLFVRAIKAMGRSVLPPSEHTGRMMLLFVLLCGVIVVLHVWLWRRESGRQQAAHAAQGSFMRTYGRLAIAYMLAMAIPILAGISTRTSEGDRLLYFPSAFLCMLGSGLLLALVERRGVRLALLGLFLAGSVSFIETNDQRWRVASQTADAILDTLQVSPASRTVLINAPDEWEGAPIFRNNIKRALVIRGILPSKVIVNNNLMRLDYLPLRGVIGVTGSADSLSIYPVTTIVRRRDSLVIRNTRTGDKVLVPVQGTLIYYWDNAGLKRVSL